MNSSRSSLANNTLWNVFGQAMPLVAAAASIPVIVRALGPDRFGLLTLAWILVGYFSILDLGLGRALTKLVAERNASDDPTNLCRAIWTGQILIMALGILGGVLCALAVPLVITHAVKIPIALKQEARTSSLVMAATIPFVVSATGFRAALEGLHRFDIITLIRIPVAMSTFLAPLAVLPYSHALPWILAALLCGRIATWLLSVRACLVIVPQLTAEFGFFARFVSPLVAFGSWMTVSNIVGPLMGSADRLFIGVLVSPAAVAFYATPYEIVGKLYILSTSVGASLFPLFVSSLIDGRDTALALLSSWLKYLWLILFPFALAVITFASQGLRLWLGADFALHGARPLQLLTISICLGSITNILVALIHAAGKPKWTAHMSLFEFPFFIPFIWYCTRTWSIEGAAVAIIVHNIVSLWVLWQMTAKVLEPVRVGLSVWLIGIISCMLFAIGFIECSLRVKGFLFAISVLFSISMSWLVVLTCNERQSAIRFLRQKRSTLVLSDL